MNQLRSVFGTWPTAEFQQRTDAEKQSFYASIRDCGNAKDCGSKAQSFLKSYEKHEESYMEGGSSSLSKCGNREDSMVASSGTKVSMFA